MLALLPQNGRTRRALLVRLVKHIMYINHQRIHFKMDRVHYRYQSNTLRTELLNSIGKPTVMTAVLGRKRRGRLLAGPGLYLIK